MRFAVGSAIAVLFCVALFVNAATSATTPWSAPVDQWTKADERLLERDLPGGRFLSPFTYQRCEKDGRLYRYHADGTTTWWGQPCWDWRRWVGRETSP